MGLSDAFKNMRTMLDKYFKLYRVSNNIQAQGVAGKMKQRNETLKTIFYSISSTNLT